MRGACARMRRFTWGRGCSEASTRKPTEALSDFLFLWRYRARRSEPRTRFSPCASGFGVFIGRTRPPRSCFYPKPAPLVVSRTALCEWGFNSVLPSASWCVVLMFVEDALIFPTPKQNYTIPSTSVDISQPCQNPFPLNPSKLNHRHQAERVLLGCFVQDDSDGWKKETNANPAPDDGGSSSGIPNVFEADVGRRRMALPWRRSAPIDLPNDNKDQIILQRRSKRGRTQGGSNTPVRPTGACVRVVTTF